MLEEKEKLKEEKRLREEKKRERERKKQEKEKLMEEKRRIREEKAREKENKKEAQKKSTSWSGKMPPRSKVYYEDSGKEECVDITSLHKMQIATVEPLNTCCMLIRVSDACNLN